jgi:hypothetical protein
MDIDNPQMKISYLKKKWLGIPFNENIHNI